MQMISPLMGCSCKMDTRFHLRARSSMGLNYNGQLMGKSCMPSCVAWKHGNIIWGCIKLKSTWIMSPCNILKHNQGLQRNKLRWHDILALLDVELIHKPRWDNVVPDALNRKEKFQLEKTLNQDPCIKGHLPRQK